MRTLAVALLVLCAVLCGCGSGTNSYRGSVQVNRVDGKVTSLEVTFPHSTSAATIKSKQEAAAAIDQLEAMLKELKSARDSMPDE